jgi:hypothetical protein
MSIFLREQYSRSATLDLETAIATALLSIIKRPFPGPGGKGMIQLAEAFEDWASFEENYVSPSAAVLPDGELVYGPSQLVPSLIEETWEPKGEQGFGLYVLSEATKDFLDTIRSSNQEERNALKAGLETAFVAPEINIAPRLGERYGTVVDMPEYWGLPVVLKLLGSRKLDDQDSSAKNNQQAEFRISAQARHVVLGPVVPFRVKIQRFEVGQNVVIPE